MGTDFQRRNCASLEFFEFVKYDVLCERLLNMYKFALCSFRLYVNWRFMRGIEAQFLALQKGFNELVPQHLLKPFDERELEVKTYCTICPAFTKRCYGFYYCLNTLECNHIKYQPHLKNSAVKNIFKQILPKYIKVHFTEHHIFL